MKNKAQINNLKTNYLKIPTKIMDCNLSVFALSIYMFFIYLPEKVDPNISYISNKLSLSRNTVYKYLKELEDRNIITKISQGFNLRDSNEWQISKYKLNNPKDWTIQDNNN